MNRTQLKRLRTLSEILFDAARIPLFVKIFTMRTWGFAMSAGNTESPDCGTPACSMGHYAARTDKQRTFVLLASGEVGTTAGSKFRDPSGAMDEHFGLEGGQRNELFGSTGCGDAQNPKQAARYIEKFAARMEKEHGLT